MLRLKEVETQTVAGSPADPDFTACGGLSQCRRHAGTLFTLVKAHRKRRVMACGNCPRGHFCVQARGSCHVAGSPCGFAILANMYGQWIFGMKSG